MHNLNLIVAMNALGAGKYLRGGILNTGNQKPNKDLNKSDLPGSKKAARPGK